MTMPTPDALLSARNDAIRRVTAAQQAVAKARDELDAAIAERRRIDAELLRLVAEQA